MNENMALTKDIQSKNKTSEKHYSTRTSRLFLILFLISLLILGLAVPNLITPTQSTTEPSIDFNSSNTSTSFLTTSTRATEPDFTLDYSPKQPYNLQPVNVTITSIHGDEITSAYLSITFIKSGLPRKGYYPFSSINSTSWYTTIPSEQNQGDTDVVFEVTVWFDDAEVHSEKFEYRVEYKGTWSSESFDDNIKLRHSPTEPYADETVNVTINSKSKSIPIKWAFLRVKYKLPAGYESPEGGINFTRINETHLYSIIPGYFGGTYLTFWVEVYDEALTKLVSNQINYTVLSLPSPGAPQPLFIKIYDDAKEEKISNVPVTIKNNTWEFNAYEHDGIVWAPIALDPGEYEIRVKYEGDVITKKVSMPSLTENFTEVEIHFNIAESKGLIADYEDFPQWFVYTWFLILIIACPIFYYTKLQLEERTKRQEKELRAQMRKERKTKTQDSLVKAHASGKKQRALDAGRSSGRSGSGTSLSSMIGSWKPGYLINIILSNEEYKNTSVRVLGLFILGLFGATWAPFYPWWMVILISVIVAAIAYRFVYLAMLVLIMFVIGAAAYQFPTFGWLFMIFALVISACSLFDWRFGYLVFMTLFISRLGFAFVVPILTGLLISLFMGIAVSIAAGIFFTFLVTSGDFLNLSFFIGPDHKYGFITFSKPVISDFMPTDYTDALASINDVNLNSMSTILHANYTSMIPFVQIVIWTIIVVVMAYLFQRYGKESIKNSLMLSLVPAFILILTTLGWYYLFDYTINIGTGLLFAGIVGVMLSMITFVFMGMELFKEFFMGKTRKVSIGTRIGELLTLRKTGFKEIGGLVEVKNELKDTMIGPLLRPEKAKEYGVEPPRGIMLFGPPGCGKTLLMRALATELNVEMIGVRCSDVMSKWYGESEGMIEKLFQEVKERRPCILFLDEIDAIAKRRDFYSADDVTPRLLSIMLSELDGMDEASGVIVVGATNKPELVDPALMRPGRFDKIIFIPAPTYKGRIDVFKIHLRGKPIANNLDIAHMARSTEGYSGADIENLVKEAAMLAMKRSIQTRKPTAITNGDFLKILPWIKPSLTHEMKKEYEKLQADFERKKYSKEIKLPPTDAEGKPSRKIKPKSVKGRAIKKRGARRAGRARKGRRVEKFTAAKWRDVVGLDNSKDFFKSTIDNYLKGGK
jgi:AAA+ superfamily predicted ATPase